MRGSTAALIAGGLLVCSLGFYFVIDRGPGAQVEGRERAASLSKNAPESSPSPLATGLVKEGTGRSLVGSPELRIELRSPEGKLVAGKLYWQFSEEHPRALPDLLVEYGKPLPEGVKVQAHDGEIQLKLPMQGWLWLRATGPGRLPLSVYERIAPFGGIQKRTLTIGPGRFGIHAIVLEQDGLALAKHRKLQLLGRDLKQGGMPTLVREVETDAFGYAVLRGLQAMSYCLSTSGARWQDPPPRTQRVIFAEGVPNLELPVSLLAAKAAVTLDLEINADFDPNRPLAPKLFLKPTEIGANTIPVDGILKPGVSKLRMSVPEGRYELSVLPLGDLLVQTEPTVLELEAGRDSRVRVQVTENPVETTISLLRLTKQFLPLHVHLLPDGPFGREDVEKLFVGPYRWRSTSAKVRGPTGKARLLISQEKHLYWLSKGKIPFDGGNHQVSLVQASRVEIRWFADSRKRRGEFLVECDTEIGRETAPLVSDLISVGGVMKPGYRAVLYVPIGVYRFRCTEAQSGKTIWTQEIVSKRPWVRHNVED